MSSTTITLKDKYGGDVVIHNGYILYRNRSIDAGRLEEIRVKGYRLTINSYKQNISAPTMCIHFPTKEDALNAHRIMLTTWYP